MIGSVFGASIRHNDNGMIHLSGLAYYLMSLLTPLPPFGNYPALYGDAIFAVYACIVSRVYRNPSDLQKKIDKRLAPQRVCIENLFSLMNNLFKLLGRPIFWKVTNKGEAVMMVSYSTFLMMNCYTCIRGNSTNIMYCMNPPMLQEYLPLDREFPPAPIVIVPDEVQFNNLYHDNQEV